MNDEMRDGQGPSGPARGAAFRRMRGWTGGLSVLALSSLLGMGARAEALPSSEEQGEILVEGRALEGTYEGSSLHRIACEGAFCLWQQTEHLGPCAAFRCANEYLTTSDRKGRALYSTWSLDPYSSTAVRFLGPLQVEIVTLRSPDTYPETDPDVGVDPTTISRGVLNLSRDGAEFTADPRAAREPTWKKKLLRQRMGVAGGREAPRPAAPVSKTVLARARATCGSEKLFPRHHDCRERTCLLILDGTEPGVEEQDEDSTRDWSFCILQVKGNDVRRLEVGEGAATVTATPDSFTFTVRDGPYGELGSQERISRRWPGYMAFVDTAGLHLEGSNPYPVREAKSLKEARALAPIVHAYTLMHVSWGSAAWKDARDLSLTWQVMRVGKDLRLHAEVDDDVVVPFDAGTGVHSDHLELTVRKASRSRESPAQAQELRYTLGVLLAAEGQVQVRLWKRGEGGKERDVDEAYAAASGTWSRSERGYVVDLSLPLASVQEADAPLGSGFSVVVSDADASGRQETLMGNTGMLRFWTEYPPALEEYAKARAQSE